MSTQYGVGEMYVRTDNIAMNNGQLETSRPLVNERASREEGFISGIWKIPTALRKAAIS